MEKWIMAILICSTVIATNYPLEIIRPAENIGQNDRIYRAYPGIEYKIRAAVIGGTFPLSYELENQPDGMYIDNGYIKWPEPDTDAGPITLRVTDSEGNIASAQWSINVTPQGFYFVNADVPEGGNGSIMQPWNSWDDFYLGLDDQTYRGAIIYFMNGTYAYPSQFTTGTTGSSNWLELREGHPLAFLAYPTNSVFFDGQRDTERIHLLADVDNQYFQGINFVRGYGYGIQRNTGNYFVVLDCTFSDFQDSGSMSNQAGVLFRFDALRNDNSAPQSDEGFTMYSAVQGNKFFNIASSGIETYGTKYTLIENNHFQDINRNSMLIKSTTDRTTIRNNSVMGSVSLLSQYYVSNTDLSFNYIGHGEGYALQVGGYDGTAGPELTYIYRNTIEGSLWFRSIDDENDGPVHIYNNIIVNTEPDDHIRDEIGEHYSITANRAILGENLLGSPADSIVENRRLTDSYAQYKGIYGYEIGNIAVQMTLQQLITIIDSWRSGETTIQQVMEAIQEWKTN